MNKVTLIGRLGHDPELRAMPSGESVCNMSLATSERWTDKSSGEKREQTEWHKLVVFGRQADVCDEYLKKGSQVAVIGALRTRKYTGKDGSDKYSTEIVVREVEFLGSKADNQERAPEEGAEHPARTRQRNPEPEPAAAGAGKDFFDDDIPF